MLLNGRLFLITKSLTSALERLQEHDRVLALWADAICINQDDLAEKGAQVQEMGTIYREASVVLGWLGPACDDSDLALKSLAQIGEGCMEMPEDPAVEERFAFFSRILPADESNPDYAFPTAAVLALLERPWWGRIWIMQEIVLSENIHIMAGKSSVPFITIVVAYVAIQELKIVSFENEGALASRIEPLQPILYCDPGLMNAANIGEPQSLHLTISALGKLDATDARDYIFALLGMANDVQELGIQADYTKTYTEIYTTVAAALLERQNKLQILSRCSFPKQLGDVPSWVPDWSDVPTAMMWSTRFHLFSAGHCAHKQELRVEGNHLKIRGAIFGSVDQLGWIIDSLKCTPEEAERITVVQAVRIGLNELSKFVDSHCTAYATPEAKEDAIWRSAITDTENALFNEHGKYNRRATPLMHTAFKTYSSAESDMDDASQRAIWRYRSFFARNLQERQYFSTSTGHVGVGPINMRKGDFVCTVLDCDVPYVLRRSAVGVFGWFQKQSRTQFELVGECYIHGIMDGEFINSSPDIEEITLV
jgi:hypothetical protein